MTWVSKKARRSSLQWVAAHRATARVRQSTVRQRGALHLLTESQLEVGRFLPWLAARGRRPPAARG